MEDIFTNSSRWNLSAAAAVTDLGDWGSDNRNITVEYEKSYEGKLFFTVLIEIDPTIDELTPNEFIRMLHPELSAKVE